MGRQKKTTQIALSDFTLSSITEQNLGSLRINKGVLPGGMKLVIWDGITECLGKKCAIHDRCTYEQGRRCTLQKKYILHVYKTYMGKLWYTKDIVDQHDLNVLGLHLIPLYSQLVRFKMEEASLRGAVMYFDNSGNAKIYPVFKEIRDILKAIQTVTDSMNLGPIGKEIATNLVDEFQHGASGYYDSLTQEASGDEAMQSCSVMKSAKRSESKGKLLTRTRKSDRKE